MWSEACGQRHVVICLNSFHNFLSWKIPLALTSATTLLNSQGIGRLKLANFLSLKHVKLKKVSGTRANIFIHNLHFIFSASLYCDFTIAFAQKFLSLNNDQLHISSMQECVRRATSGFVVKSTRAFFPLFSSLQSNLSCQNSFVSKLS